MKKNAEEYLFYEAIKYLGKYPATKKKIENFLQSKIRNKKIQQKIIFPENIDKNLILENIINKLDNLNIINESYYLESMFDYYLRSLFSINKIKNKLYQKGFNKNEIDDYITLRLKDDHELEIEILKKYIIKKNLSHLESIDLKKKLYQQGFSENSIYKIIKE